MIWKDVAHDDTASGPNRQFIKDKCDLLYFIDPDYQPQLCVSSSLCNFVLREVHENLMESSHAGPVHLWQQLSQKFYWKHMKPDVLTFACSCDICQKIKFSNFNKFGFLILNPIPSRLYQSISMDFIVNLPWSGEYNTIFIVVDRLTKDTNFILTTTGLTAEGFGALYIKHIGCRFRLPESIIMDRDPRWMSNFWRGITKYLQTKMSLSSSHHPQHDGQTEVVNKQLVTML